MAIKAGKLIKWLQTLDLDSLVCIDEDGLSLELQEDDCIYLEVGGYSDSTDEDEDEDEDVEDAGECLPFEDW